MLSPKNRIKKKKEFEKILKTGEALFGLFFFLKIKESQEDFSRFAFVFPYKSEKMANRRNKGKRIFREVTRGVIPFLKRNIDGIFVLKKETNNKTYAEIKEDVESVLKKNNLI